MICFGVLPAHGRGVVVPSWMQSAISAAMCGGAMLVPDMVDVGKPAVIPVDAMHTPGAAIVCAIPSAVLAKFDHVAAVSSACDGEHDGAAPAGSDAPLASLAAVTVRTSG